MSDLDRPVPVATVFLALLRRDLVVSRRELPFFVLRTAMQPILFLIVFGFLLPKMGFTRSNYESALVPGILAISVSMASVQAVAFPMVQDFGRTNEIEDRLLAPVPIRYIALEKIANGVLQGSIAGLFVLPIARLIMGPIVHVTWEQAGLLLCLVLLGAAAFAALGLVFGVVVEATQIGFLFSLVIAPMMFFGCAYYPWRSLAVVPWLQYVVLVNPLVYMSEAMRGALTPDSPHMPVWASAGGLAALLILFTAVGLHRFERKAVS